MQKKSSQQKYNNDIKYGKHDKLFRFGTTVTLNRTRLHSVKKTITSTLVEPKVT